MGKEILSTYETKDSGKRESHNSGAVRDSREGKGRYDLLTPLAIRRVAQLYERGAVKYAARNWEKGMALSRYMDSALRHGFNYLEGMRDEDHLAAMVWNGLAMIHTEEMIKRGLFPKEFDDMPNYLQIKDEIDKIHRDAANKVTKLLLKRKKKSRRKIN